MTHSPDWAPVALFIYKRPEHLRRTIQSLQACQGFESSPIYVFADGPKARIDDSAVRATREVARELLGTRAIFLERERNHGLANSIIAGVTDLCDRHGKVIVVEDDLLVAPSFLCFLNDGLDRYRDEPRVMQVSGHMFDVPAFAHRREALLLPMTTSWGWATWKRAWALFDPLATGWRERLHPDSVARRFNLNGRYDYLRMLRRQMNGEIDSWAIRWYYSVFAQGGLALFPPRTLVSNMGFDGSGTHGRLRLAVRQAALDSTPPSTLPVEIAESRHKAQVFDAISASRSSSVRGRLLALTRIAIQRLGEMRAEETR